MTNTIPNMDAMTIDELSDFWARYSRARRQDAENLIGDRRKGYTTLASDLANYAINKATAMRCRLNGKIDAALIYEGICDRIYDSLPSDLRW